MKQAGIQAKTVKKFRVITTDSNHSHPVAENLVDRNFSPTRKNQTWTADITYIATDEGWLYLAAVEDLYSRKIVGWSMSDRIDSRLVVDALQMPIPSFRHLKGLLLSHLRGYGNLHNIWIRKLKACHSRGGSVFRSRDRSRPRLGGR
jgi:transposase InsO family protein